MLILQQVRRRSEPGRALARPLGHGLVQVSSWVGIQLAVRSPLALMRFGLCLVWVITKLAAKLPQLLVPVLRHRRMCSCLALLCLI